MPMKSETAAHKGEITRLSEGLLKLKLSQGKGFFKIGVEKKHGEANSIFLEMQGHRKFEIGNDCDTCHFWFKCLQDPKMPVSKKVANLPKTIQLPRPVDETMVGELQPLLDLMDKGEYALFETSVNLAGPYDSDDENSYFHNTEFMELWDVADPKEEDLLSGWEHYEGNRPRIFRHGEGGLLEKQFDFIIPLVPGTLKEEYVKLYQSMISQGDRPRILLLGLYQRGVPRPSAKARGSSALLLWRIRAGRTPQAGRLPALRRAGEIPHHSLLQSQQVFPPQDEGTSVRAKLDDRLGASRLIAEKQGTPPERRPCYRPPCFFQGVCWCRTKGPEDFGPLDTAPLGLSGLHLSRWPGPKDLVGSPSGPSCSRFWPLRGRFGRRRRKPFSPRRPGRPSAIWPHPCPRPRPGSRPTSAT